jgi:oxygen-dependent protoporphyrinogen oxidase
VDLDVGVIGAGPAGLAAAWTLAARGARVTVYERRAEVGGRMRTDVLDGARVDVAVQLLGSYYRETLRLAEEVGAGGLLVRSPGRDALWRGGRAHPVTYGSITSMVVSTALPASLKLRLATRYVPFLTWHAGALDAAEPSAAVAAGLDDESIASWGRRELGEEFVELLAYPLLAAYYGGVPEEISAGFYHALARAGMDVAVYAVRGGVAELARAIVGAIERRGGRLVAGELVEAVEVRGEGVGVRRPGGSARHDAVVVAVPPASVPAILELDGLARAWLERVRSDPTASLALLLDRPLPVEHFGLSFPRTEPPGDRVAAVCVEERKGPGLVPAGEGLVVVFPAPAVAPRVAEATPEEALDYLLPAVERAYPGIERSVRRARLYRFPEGITRFYPGYLAHLRRFDPSWLPPRVALAGDYLVAPTVEGAVRSGRRAAERLLAMRPA